MSCLSKKPFILLFFLFLFLNVKAQIDTALLFQQEIQRLHLPKYVDTVDIKDLRLLYDSPDRISRNLYYISLFQFSLMKENAIGPFGIEFRYLRIINSKNTIEFLGNFQPMDFRFITSDADKKYPYVQFGGIGTYFFSSHIITRSKNLTYDVIPYDFTIQDNKIQNFYRFTIKTKLEEIKRSHKYGIRYGIHYQQNSTLPRSIQYPDDSRFEIYNQRQLMLNVGFSKTVWINYEYITHSNHVIKQNFKKVKLFYIDFLLSPIVNVNGSYIQFPDYKEDQTTFPKSEHHLIPVNYFGARIGGKIMKTGIISPSKVINKLPPRNQRTGGYIGYEFGVYPGVYNNTFIATLVYGISFFSKPIK